MDVATVIGLLVGLLSLVIGFLMEGGELIALLKITAFLIVFGGTFGAVIVSFPGKILAKAPFILKYAFIKPKERSGDTIIKLIDLANISRREGLLALEGEQSNFQNDSFMSNGIQMVVDGVDSDVIDDILNRDIELYEQKILSIARMFESAGGYAPTMGIIGTVMGLVHVLGSLEDAAALGPAIAVAFIATLYGVGSANVIYLPIFTKIKNNLASEIMIRQLKTEGILSIQYGESTMILKKKLYAFLTEKECQDVEQALTSGGNKGTNTNRQFQEAGQSS